MKKRPNHSTSSHAPSAGRRIAGHGRVVAFASLLLVTLSIRAATISNYTATGWVSSVPNLGIWVTNAQGAVFFRGNAHTALVLSDDPRLNGLRTIFVNGDYDATGTAAMWGTAYQQVGTFDAQNQFTPSGGCWELDYRGSMPSDNSMQVTLVGRGSGGSIDGLRLEEQLTRDPGGVLDPAIPYHHAGTIRPAPVNTAEVLDTFDDNRFTGTTWGSGFVVEADRQFTARVRATAPVSSIVDAYVFAGYENRGVTIPNGLTREWRADLIGLSEDATNNTIMAAGSTDVFYAFYKSHHCAYLLKWPNAMVMLAADAVSIRNTNVTMSLAVTRMNPNLILTARILDKANPGTVLYERTVVDTPNIDPTLTMAQFQAATGMRLTDFSEDVTGGLPSVFNSVLGVWQYGNGQQTQAEAVWDNLELRTSEIPGVGVERAVRLTFPTPAGYNYGLEAASSLQGPWLPVTDPAWPGMQRVTVPASESMKFFRLREAP